LTCFRPADSPAIIQEHKVVATGVRCARCRNRRVLTALREKCDEDADWLRRMRSSVALLQRDLLSLLCVHYTYLRAYAGKGAPCPREQHCTHRQSATAKLHGECDSCAFEKRRLAEICGLTRLDDGGR
jgi:hypothetical protein